MKHPFYGSWGYQTTGYFAPTGRYGTPQDLMFLIDTLHQRGIGVILDWVPSHFPTDEHGLAYFDGTHLYEHADMRQGFQPDWNSYIFNYGRHEVQQFPPQQRGVLARHIITPTACAWTPWPRCSTSITRANRANGFRTSTAGAKTSKPLISCASSTKRCIASFRTCKPTPRNPPPGRRCRGPFTWADWASASSGTWVSCTTRSSYFSKDPVHRKYHHSELTFRAMYAFSENFVLPFSHDEVVHGKGSMLRKMPGDDWRKFANLRLLLAYQFLQPGKKLLFMGAEFGQWNEWYHETSLDWHLVQDGNPHNGVQKLVGTLNWLYRTRPRAARTGRRTRRGSSGWTATMRNRARLSWLRLGIEAGGRGAGRLQFHARAAPQRPRRRAARRLLEGIVQHRRARITAAAARATSAAWKPRRFPGTACRTR